MVVLVPEPVEVVPPGDLVKVQVPVVGNPFKTTLPVATAHVGCVMLPNVGAEGAVGCASITTSADASEVRHPKGSVLVTVKL